MKFLNEHYATYSLGDGRGRRGESPRQGGGKGIIWNFTAKKRTSTGSTASVNVSKKTPSLVREPFGLPISHIRRTGVSIFLFVPVGDKRESQPCT